MNDQLPVMVTKMMLIYVFIMALLFMLNHSYNLWIVGLRREALIHFLYGTACVGLIILAFYLLAAPL